MGRIALLLGGFLLLATPAQAGLMDLLESIESPLLESPELPPLPDEPGEGKNWVGTEIPKPDLPILVLAGHADSQRMAGSGTLGAPLAWAEPGRCSQASPMSCSGTCSPPRPWWPRASGKV